jgi:hypothetical protein
MKKPPAKSWDVAKGESGRVGRPRRASVEEGPTEMSRKTAPDDRKMCRIYVVGDWRSSESNPRWRRVLRASFRWELAQATADPDL